MPSHASLSCALSFVVLTAFGASASAADLTTPHLRVDASVVDLSASLAASVLGDASSACARENGLADTDCLTRLLAPAFEDGRAKRLASPSLGVLEGEEASYRSDLGFPQMVIDATGVHETARMTELALAFVPRIGKDGAVEMDVTIATTPVLDTKAADAPSKPERREWKSTVVLAKDGTALFRLTRAKPVNQPAAAGLPLIGGLFRLPEPREVFVFVKVGVESRQA